jgi:hypothetical protein
MSSTGSIIGIPPISNPYLPGTIPAAVPSTPTGSTSPFPLSPIPTPMPPVTTLPTITPTAVAPPIPVAPASPGLLKKYWWVAMIAIVGLLYWQRKKVNKIIPWG